MKYSNRNLIFFVLYSSMLILSSCSMQSKSQALHSDEMQSDDMQSNVEKSVQKNQNEAAITLKFAHNWNEDHLIHKELVKMADNISRQTNGNLTIQFYPNSVLGTDSVMMRQLQDNTLDMMKISSSYAGSFAPLYEIFELPYLFQSKEHFHKVMQSDIAKEIFLSSKDRGFITIGYAYTGSRSFYTKDKPINSPDDLNGLRMRVIGTPIDIKMMKTFGAIPMPIPFAEVYESLKDGVIDGAENNVISLINVRHGDFAKEYSFDEHSIVPDLIVVNQRTWNTKLSKEYRDLITKELSVAMARSVGEWEVQTGRDITFAKTIGVNFTYPDKKPFQDATRFIIEEQKAKDSTKKRIIEAIMNMK